MKKLIICSLTALTISSNAQATWNGIGATGDANRTGRIGINTSSPTYALDVFSASGNGYDGISVTNANSTGNCGLFLKNSSISKQWQLWSLGTGNAWGAGNFCIYNGVAAQPQIFIENSTGNVGVGTNVPNLSKLNVLNNIPLISNNWNDPYATQWAVKGSISPTTAKNSEALTEYDIAIEGDASTAYTGEGFMVGVKGFASNGLNNYAGVFEANSGNQNNVGASNFGVKVKSYGNYHNYGVFAEVAPNSGPGSNQFACWFVGNTYSSSNSWTGSDIKLKNDIKPLTNSLELLMKLKPSSYTFKTNEFKSMNLPQGTQMGLIAQELETVFPDLVKEMQEISEIDKDGKKKVISPEFKAVQYTSLIPVLIAAMQEQQTQIESQQTTIASQQKQIDEQKQLINQLLQKAATPTGLDQNSLGAAGYAMEQNQPNPFNGVTTVKYTLPASVVNAYMAVYDLAGKQIASFPIAEKGSSSINITSEKLAAGIYIYSIVADNKVIDSKRMIVSEK